MSKLLVEVYGRKDCSMCNKASKVIGRVKEEMPFQYKEVDISCCDDLSRRYGDDIPTVFINGTKAFKFKVDESEFRKKVRKEIIKAGISRIAERGKDSVT